jgi:hypothetical protein
MDEPRLHLRTIFDLRLDERECPILYRIPSYQRGYRWDRQQVTQLLDDIKEFADRETPDPSEFYCLQPLVIRSGQGGSYEVVDGQQRLTTILLILRHFNERLSDRFQQKTFAIEYDSRKRLQEYFDDPTDENAAKDIDYFHIHSASLAIAEWFLKHENEVEHIKSTFLNKTKVIWFQIDQDENAVDAFTRLNIGKIPLTDSELIRGLFLRRTGKKTSDSLRLKIAYEWDLFEKSLQRNEFWCFLSNRLDVRENRISFLFELITESERSQATKEQYATFYHFSGKLNGKGRDPEREWREIKKAYMLFEEWYEDRRLFHLIGFLICTGMHIPEIRKLGEKCDKTTFREIVRRECYQRVMGVCVPTNLQAGELRSLIADRISDLNYGQIDRRTIRSFLLLFNIATLLLNSQSNARFPFENFKGSEWDIEHIRSVAGDQPGNRKAQREWLGQCLDYLRNSGVKPDLALAIETYLNRQFEPAYNAEFESLYEKILLELEQANDNETDNSLLNLTLLDAQTNRSYKNAIFAVKRDRILSLDKGGAFVPLCTRNVFLKCYTRNEIQMAFWSEFDRSGYENAILETLVRFFEGDWIHD